MFYRGVTLVLQQFGRLKRMNGNFSYFIYVWKRWYRLSIALFGILMFIYLYPLTGNGPFWFANDQFFVAPCKKPFALWATFLYYSNWNNVILDYEIVHSIPIVSVQLLDDFWTNVPN